MSAPELYGLVLAGGRSTRMGRDKASLDYRGKPHALALHEELASICVKAFISCRGDQRIPADLALIDRYDNIGPMAGLLTAFDHQPAAAWLVVACDLPFLDRATLEHLVASRDPSRPATAYRGRLDGLPEPLCAIYEPAMRDRLHQFVREGITCPRKALIRSEACLIDLQNPYALENANSPDAAERARGAPRGGIALEDPPPDQKRLCDACPPKLRTIEVRIYAVMREKAGQHALRLETAAHTTRDVYAEVARTLNFDWPKERLRVAVNDVFCGWDHPVREHDVIHFIPPVAGG